jgi:hypothetical protein
MSLLKVMVLRLSTNIGYYELSSIIFGLEKKKSENYLWSNATYVRTTLTKSVTR